MLDKLWRYLRGRDAAGRNAAGQYQALSARAAAMTRTPLTGADLFHWIALRRVAHGGIARMGDRWYDTGRRTPDYVADALAELCHAGLVALADPGPGGMARTALTAAGTARYEQLCQQRAHEQSLGAADRVRLRRHG